MIVIIDYGAGNLFSVKNALDFLGEESVVSSDPEEIEKADKLILPGVGAFPDAMKQLEEKGLKNVIKKEALKKPFLGICLGMQMLFETSYEFEEYAGLALIPGRVTLIDGNKNNENLKVPHMGWSDIDVMNDCPLTKGIFKGDRFYFVHSYKVETEDDNISLFANYGDLIPGLVFRDNIYGCQFHPEKSGKIGLKLLKNFASL